MPGQATARSRKSISPGEFRRAARKRPTDDAGPQGEAVPQGPTARARSLAGGRTPDSRRPEGLFQLRRLSHATQAAAAAGDRDADKAFTGGMASGMELFFDQYFEVLTTSVGRGDHLSGLPEALCGRGRTCGQAGRRKRIAARFIDRPSTKNPEPGTEVAQLIQAEGRLLPRDPARHGTRSGAAAIKTVRSSRVGARARSMVTVARSARRQGVFEGALAHHYFGTKTTRYSCRSCANIPLRVAGGRWSRRRWARPPPRSSAGLDADPSASFAEETLPPEVVSAWLSFLAYAPRSSPRDRRPPDGIVFAAGSVRTFVFTQLETLSAPKPPEHGRQGSRRLIDGLSPAARGHRRDRGRHRGGLALVTRINVVIFCWGFADDPPEPSRCF